MEQVSENMYYLKIDNFTSNFNAVLSYALGILFWMTLARAGNFLC